LLPAQREFMISTGQAVTLKHNSRTLRTQMPGSMTTSGLECFQSQSLSRIPNSRNFVAQLVAHFVEFMPFSTKCAIKQFRHQRKKSGALVAALVATFVALGAIKASTKVSTKVMCLEVPPETGRPTTTLATNPKCYPLGEARIRSRTFLVIRWARGSGPLGDV
jgi:hypothetical protein